MTIETIKKMVIPILKKYNIVQAGFFGSFTKGENTSSSDIDILVELGNAISLFEFVRIKFELEDKLNLKVDLVEYKAIKPRLRDRILSEEMRIYG